MKQTTKAWNMTNEAIRSCERARVLGRAGARELACATCTRAQACKHTQAPGHDAQIIMDTRFPVPRYIVCDQHKSQSRFLMAKLNPSAVQVLKQHGVPEPTHRWSFLRPRALLFGASREPAASSSRGELPRAAGRFWALR